MDRKEFIQASMMAGTMPFLNRNIFGDYWETEGTAIMSEPALNNSYWYIGHLMSLLIPSKDTGGKFALLHGFEVKGLEPPPHVHTREDESFYLLDGEINFIVGEQTYPAKKGHWMFLPRNIQHTFQVQTDHAEVLVHLSPGGFENYFIEMSEPARELAIPPKPQGPPDIKRLVETASRYGIRFPGMDSKPVNQTQ